MDVTGWTIEQRMRLPDWVFGSRQVVSARVAIFAANTFAWKISDVALPDPCCIWKVGMFIRKSDHQSNYFRMALAPECPVNEAQMDIAQEILPDFGSSGFAPERIYTFIGGGAYFVLDTRKGIETGGQKLVVEGHVNAAGTALLVLVNLVISALPTDMAGWLEHGKV